MKRSLFNRQIKQSMLAIPAAALMLGAAQAQTTIGINFVAQYAGYAAVGSGYGGYQTSGFPVTATAFGVTTNNWVNTGLMSGTGYSMTTGPLSISMSYPDVWESAVGDLNPYQFYSGGGAGDPGTYWAVLATVNPGNDEVTWGIEDTGGSGWQNTISGLATAFPNGYVIEMISASGNTGTKLTSSSQINVTDNASVNTNLSFNIIYAAGNTLEPGLVGLATTPVLTSDSITMTMGASNTACSLAGFILTDVPVISRNVPAAVLGSTGAPLGLPSPNVFGIGLTYQWQLNGTNIPGATSATYTNASLTTGDDGLYQAIVSSTYFPSTFVTGQVANVTVVPPHAARTAYWDPAITGAATDGSGSWGYSLTNWWSGTNDDYWGNADTAVFGAGGTGTYTVTLSASVTGNAIDFDSGVYTITNAAGETLTLNGQPAVTANTNATITVPFSTGTNAFLKAGAGTLTLSGALTCASTLVDAGTLVVDAKNGDSPYVVTNGATLKIGYSTSPYSGSAGVHLYGNGASATTGFYLAGGKNYTVYSGFLVAGSPTTIRQYGSGLASFGTYDINSAPGLSISASASGSVLDPNIQLVSDGYGMVVTTAAGTNTATGDLVINGPLNVGSLGLLTEGTGSVLLNGVANPANVALNVMAGSVICGTNNCIGTNAVLNVGALGVSYQTPSSSALIDLKGTSQTVSNAVFGGTLKMTINRGGSTGISQLTSWGQPVTYGGTLVVTNIGGTLQLGDTFTLFYSTPGYFNGSFSTVILPTVANGLAWQNNLSSSGSITVIAGSTPPSMVKDLTGATNYAFSGGNANFSVVAAGDPTLEYRWLKNGVTTVGANSPNLTLTSVTTGSQGYYSVTVTNNYGSTSSQSNYLDVVTADAVEAASVTDAPLSFWPLSETNGPTAYDYWSGNNGTDNGVFGSGAGPSSPAYPGFGTGTTAYEFDGQSTYIACSTNASLSGAVPFTLEAWINTTNFTNSMAIIEQRTTGTSGYLGEYQFTVNPNGTLTFGVFANNSSSYSLSSAAVSRRVNDGKWHHVAAVQSSTNAAIYVDGSQVASASETAVALSSSIPVFIGADYRDGGSYFSGAMCNVAIYNSALSAARIGAHASAGWLGTSPLAIKTVSGGWIEDSKPIGTLLDAENLGVGWLSSVTDANSVTVTNVATFQAGAQIAIPPNAAFNSPTGTICFWMQMPLPVTGHGATLFDRRTGSGLVMVSDGGLNGQIDVQWTGATNSLITTGTFYQDGNWHHIALTYDQSAAGNVTMYVDGNQVGTQANVSAWSWPTGQEIELGRSHDTYWQELTGTMSDFRIYNQVLLGSDISTIYSGGSGGPLVYPNSLVVRYNFGTAAGVGTGLTWPIGVLQNAPVLGQPTAWTPIGTTSPVYPYIPRAGTTNSAEFYGLKL